MARAVRRTAKQVQARHSRKSGSMVRVDTPYGPRIREFCRALPGPQPRAWLRYGSRMDAQEAERLIAPAVPAGPAVWADFGAGDGTFTRALAERLGPGSRIYAVDR